MVRIAGNIAWFPTPLPVGHRDHCGAYIAADMEPPTDEAPQVPKK